MGIQDLTLSMVLIVAVGVFLASFMDAIAGGGGIILRPENMEILSATGTVYFLDRDPRDIANTELDGRPLLSGGRDRVFLLYDQRINLYRKYARYTVPSTTVDETVDSVLALVRRGQDVR